MDVIDLVLLIAAAVVFAIAAFNASVGRVNLIALGLLLLTMIPLLREIDRFT